MKTVVKRDKNIEELSHKSTVELANHQDAGEERRINHIDLGDTGYSSPFMVFG